MSMKKRTLPDVSIEVIEPIRQPSKVVITMTDKEACELRDELSLDEAHAIGDVTLKIAELIHEVTEEW